MALKRRKIPGFQSIDEAMSTLNVSERTLWRWINEEDIATSKKSTFLSDADVERLKRKRQSNEQK